MTRLVAKNCLYVGLTVVVFAWVVSCESAFPFPGNELMGTFGFTADPLPADSSDAGGAPLPQCNLVEVDGGSFFFVATFSRFQADGGVVFLTLGEVTRDAGFDGQIASSAYDAPRQFSAYSCDGTLLRETLEVALLSSSQELALRDCPENALDGGVPVNPDAGIFPPRTTPHGFDATLACGLLIDEVIPGVTCKCDGGPCSRCELRYRLKGVLQ